MPCVFLQSRRGKLHGVFIGGPLSGLQANRGNVAGRTKHAGPQVRIILPVKMVVIGEIGRAEGGGLTRPCCSRLRLARQASAPEGDPAFGAGSNDPVTSAWDSPRSHRGVVPRTRFRNVDFL